MSNTDKFIQLADDMASAASSFNSHGYDSFIQAREIFKAFVNDYCRTSNNPDDPNDMQI